MHWADLVCVCERASLFVTFIISQIFCFACIDWAQHNFNATHNHSIAWWKVLYIFNPLPSLSSLKTFNAHPVRKKSNICEVYFVSASFFLLNYQLNDCNNVISLTTQFFMRTWVFVSLIHWSGTVEMIVRTFHVPERKTTFLKQFLFNFYSFYWFESIGAVKFWAKNTDKALTVAKQKKPFHYWLRAKRIKGTDIEQKKVQQ